MCNRRVKVKMTFALGALATALALSSCAVTSPTTAIQSGCSSTRSVITRVEAAYLSWKSHSLPMKGTVERMTSGSISLLALKNSKNSNILVPRVVIQSLVDSLGQMINGIQGNVSIDELNRAVAGWHKYVAEWQVLCGVRK